jgi:hypothetical protein
MLWFDAMTTQNKQQMIVAIAVNIGLAQLLANWLGFPRWAGTVAASSAMVAASRPALLPPRVRQALEVVVLPGNLAANLVETHPQLKKECNCDDHSKQG